MGVNAAPLEKLIEQFARLNGIGRKGAARLAYQVLAMDHEQALAFSDAIRDAHEKIHRCVVCQNFTEAEDCVICRDATRDRSTICVVESPRDVTAFEHTREYKGLYHVLHGLISPTEGIGVEQLSVQELLARLADGTVTEVIMATNPTVEGDGTALHISNLLAELPVEITRLARGITPGSVLEFTNKEILADALAGRQRF